MTKRYGAFESRENFAGEPYTRTVQFSKIRRIAEKVDRCDTKETLC